jgi:hypothetical protein
MDTTEEGNSMRNRPIIGTAVYLGLVLAVMGGSYAAIQSAIGPVGPLALATPIEKQGPILRRSGKWTPVEIQRDVADAAPPLPPYVIPAKRVEVAKQIPKKRVVVVARRAAPPLGQQVAAYSSPEQPRMFGPFFLGN